MCLIFLVTEASTGRNGEELQDAENEKGSRRRGKHRSQQPGSQVPDTGIGFLTVDHSTGNKEMYKSVLNHLSSHPFSNRRAYPS